MAAASSATTTVDISGATAGGSLIPSPPPPTPSNHPHASGAGGADVALSAFLHRLLLSSPAPTLSSPPPASRFHSPQLPALVSLESPDASSLLAAADVGYFHLADHGVLSHLPSSALDELSLLDASAHRASNSYTLGFSEEEQETDCADDPFMVFDVDEAAIDALPAAAEYARRMKEVGMEVVRLLSGCPGVGFGEEPFGEGRRKARCLMWVSKAAAAGESAPPAAGKAKAYPYAVGLHCQWEAAGREAAPASWVLGDDGEWTAVGARDGSVLVTIGDIAQVWSNGKFKKVRGSPHPSFPGKDGHGGSERLSVTILITLSLDNVISPLVPFLAADEEGAHEMNRTGVDGDGWKFHSFLLEEYTWRVYNERLQFKDPLARYRM